MPFDRFPPDNFVQGPVSPLDQDVGDQRVDHPRGGIVVEKNNVVDQGERRQNFQSLPVGNDGTGRPFQAPDRGIGINADNQAISQRAGGGKVPDMADVEKVKAAVRKNDLFTRLLKGADLLSEGGKRLYFFDFQTGFQADFLILRPPAPGRDRPPIRPEGRRSGAGA